MHYGGFEVPETDPNIIHGIIIIDNGNRVDVESPVRIESVTRPTPTLGDIICSFKSECVTDYIKYIKERNLILSAKIWQRNFYDRIIRNDNELDFYRYYIKTNPEN